MSTYIKVYSPSGILTNPIIGIHLSGKSQRRNIRANFGKAGNGVRLFTQNLFEVKFKRKNK